MLRSSCKLLFVGRRANGRYAEPQTFTVVNVWLVTEFLLPAKSDFKLCLLLCTYIVHLLNYSCLTKHNALKTESGSVAS